MKYYFCLVLSASVLNGMDASDNYAGSPTTSSQWHSAPNSPSSERKQYSRKALLEMAPRASSSMSALIKIDQIKVIEENPEKSSPNDGLISTNTTHKKPAVTSKKTSRNYRRYAKKP